MKPFHRVLHIGFALFLGLDLLLLSHQVDGWVFQTVSRLTSWPIQLTWSARLQTGAWIALHVGLIAYLFLQIAFFQRTRTLSLWQRIKQFFARFPEPNEDLPALGWSGRDGLILALFLACGVVFFFSMIQSGPFPNLTLGGDAANLASFAAGLDHPTWFSRDAILADPQNLRSYSTLNVQLIRWLAPWAGSYALALTLPILILVPLNLAGFYLLGRSLFRRRFWAGLLVLALAVPLKLNMGEMWGVVPNAVTRYYFQALIPFLLVWILAWRSRPRFWPWLVIPLGLLAFVHPVSTPAWAAAVWCGFAVLLPAGWPRSKKIGVMAGLAALTLATLLPYALNYFGAGETHAEPLTFQSARRIVDQYFPPFLLYIPIILDGLGRILWQSGLLPVSLILGGSLWLLPARDRSRLKLALAWLAGILLAAAALPWLEHTLELALRIVPFETEMVRSLRYVVFFLVLFSVWALAEWQRRLPDPRWRRAVAVLGVGLLLAWGAAADLEEASPAAWIRCLQQGRLVCGAPDDGDRLVEAVARLTPPGAALYSTFAEQGRLNQSLPIRYQALRSLVFCYKDHGQLVTAHSPAAETWLDRVIDLERIVQQDPPAQQMERHLFLAHQWGATHLITDLRLAPEWVAAHSLTTLYQNDTYLLLQMR